MSYKSNKRKNNRVVRGVIIFVVVLCILIFRRPIFSIFGAGTSVVATPVWGVGQFISGEITENFLSLQSKRTLIKKLIELQDKFLLLGTLQKERDVLYEENIELEQALGLYKSGEFETMARILSRPPKVSYDTIVIDQGSRDGILVGDRVFAEGNIFLGVVKNVDLTSSSVEMLSTSGIETESRLTISDLSLTLVGRGGGSFSADIPRDIPVEEGGYFVSVFDAGELVAEIARVTGDPQDPVKTIVAKTPVNIRHLSYVFVKRF